MQRLRRLVAAIAATATIATTVVTGAVPDGDADAYTTYAYSGAGASVPWISVIGDSTVAALRWMGDYGDLRQFNFVYDAESCRRTTGQSCRGREGYAPDNVLTTMRRLSGRLGSVMVIMGGYDDPGLEFGSSVDAIMAEAARQGVPTVMWLTLRTADVSYNGPNYVSNAFTFRDNNRILLAKAAQYGDRLQIADWATYSASQSGWVLADGVHLSRAGAYAVASYISTTARRVLGGLTVTPPIGPVQPWTPLRYGDRSSNVAALQRALALAGYNLFGAASGVFGMTTRAAVIRFQQAYRLPATGVVDAVMAQRLGLVNYAGVARPPAWRPLQLAMSGRGVAAAQQRLAQLGYYAFPATGVFGPQLRNAVKAFQGDRGLPATGVIDEATAEQLSLYSGVWTALRPSLQGSRVEQAQRALVAAGVSLSGGVNGLYGQRMAAAVRAYQSAQGLPVTGVIDSATAIRLGIYRAPSRVSVWVNLTFETVNPAVGSIQRTLMARGYSVPGGATNRFDMSTRAAVIAFQRDNGLTVTGIVDGPTAQRLGLFDMSASATWQTIYLYSASPYVAQVERALIAAGYAIAGGANNVFDRSAYLAVRSFQSARGLPVTGLVNWATANALGLFGTPATAQGQLMVASAPAPTTTTTSTTSTTSTTTSTTTVPPSSTESSNSPVVTGAVVTIGDLVWLDVDGDGTQDDDEGGVADVVVRALDESGATVAETRSDAHGHYHLALASTGQYLLEVVLPAGLVPTPADQGVDDEVDADIVTVDDDSGTARSEAFALEGVRDDLDIGLSTAPPLVDPPGSTADDGSSPIEPPAGSTPEPTSPPMSEPEDDPAATEPPGQAGETTVATASDASDTTMASTAPPTTAPPTTAPPTTATTASTVASTTPLAPPATEAPTATVGVG